MTTVETTRVPSREPREPREPRAVRRARRQVAFHADRARRAATEAKRMKAAADELLSAAAHTRQPIGEVADSATDQARWVLGQAELTPGARALYEDQLTRHRTPQARLGAALMCLRAAIGRLPVTGEERDRLYAHYTTELTAEAGRLREGR